LNWCWWPSRGAYFLETPIGRQAGWSVMTVIVVGGVVLNVVALYALGAVLERWWHARR